MTPAQITEGQKIARELAARIELNKSGIKLPSAEDPSPSGLQVKSLGSGFFITADGYLLTNHHVVKGANLVVVVTAKGRLPATVVKVDEAKNTDVGRKGLDLAVLKVKGRFDFLPVSSSRPVKLGDRVFATGFPKAHIQGKQIKLTTGSINGLAGLYDDARYFQIQVPIQGGNSGGPLIDEYGNVVGINTLGLLADKYEREIGDAPQLVNYAIKSSFANAFLETLPQVVSKLKEPHPRGKKRSIDEVRKEAIAATVLILIY